MASETPALRINLKEATILVADPNTQGAAILSQILLGFGTTKVLKAATYSQACKIVEKQTVDLIICEAILAPDDSDGYDFVHWLRRSKLEPNAYAPTIIISAHTSKQNVDRGRDCGANFFVRKPLIPTVMLERIVWIARENRRFVECDAYVGPERRFKNAGPPPGSDGRRSTDLSAAVGAPVGGNLSQDDIDSLMQPKRATL